MNKPKIEFAPGAFDQFEGTQEELDQMILEITQMFENLTAEELAERSRPMTEEDFNELPEEVQAQLMDFEADNPVSKKRLQ